MADDIKLGRVAGFLFASRSGEDGIAPGRVVPRVPDRVGVVRTGGQRGSARPFPAEM